ncbi:MAG: M15 family metallopeptidase [Myxococcales bacterium]|nr:M15 family metallopeptidase [Myxococcales bacterium]
MSAWLALIVALLGPEPAAPPSAEAAAPASAEAAEDPGAPCTYRTYSWDVQKKRGVNNETIRKTRGELAADERDPQIPACTVCSEDQVDVAVEGLPTVTVCRLYADRVRTALAQAHADGFQIKTLIGYRVGRTRGAIKGTLRTEFSNHSYGTAIDINAEQNGLYGDCGLKQIAAGAGDLKGCKLRVGGAWDPARRPKVTVREGGPAWKAFTAFWKWGGARTDKTRDFMHFSPTGE